MRFVFNSPALVLGRRLLVSDVDVGVELALSRKGVLLPLQHLKTAELLNGLLREAGCNELFILGDAKHDFLGAREDEVRVLNSFFHAINAKVTVVKGNHDSQIEKVGGIRVVDAKGLLVKEKNTSYLLLHGHAAPDEKDFAEADVVVMGHHHPLVEVKEGNGFAWREKAWVVGEFARPRKRFVVLPAFSELSGGVAFTSKTARGPFFANYGLSKSKTRLFLLSGVCVGRLSDLER